MGAQRRTQPHLTGSRISEAMSELGLKHEYVPGRRTLRRKINKWEEGSHVWGCGALPTAEALGGGGTGAAGQVSRDAREHGLYPTGKSETIEIFLKMR